MMTFIHFVLLISILLFQFSYVFSFANYMTSEFCSTPLEAGEIIMGNAAVLSSEKVVKVYRNDEEVDNGSTYSVGDKLEVKLDPAPTGLQLVFEVKGGLRFYGGKCDGRTRTNTYGASIHITPATFADSQELHIIGAWAISYSDGVKITAEPFILHKSASTEANSGDL